jgi:predicted DNA-binding transcriptional regulator AlpA
MPTTQPDPSDNRPVWTGQRIRALGAATDLLTAASIFGMGRTQAYQLAKDGTFPVPVLRIGTRYRVPVAAILTALHMEAEPPT